MSGEGYAADAPPKLVRKLHEKGGLVLGKFELADGRSAYGVMQSGAVVMLGTKAEAKERYGSRWSATRKEESHG